MTTWPGWGMRRARSALVLLTTLFALVAVTTGILSFALGNSGLLATGAARAALRSADASEAGVRAQTRLGPDADAQDAIARSGLTEGFSPAPVEIWTTFLSEPRPAATAEGALPERLVLWSGSHLNPAVLSIDGAWPAGPGEAALHRDAATAVGVEVGDVLTVDEHELTLTALWVPADPAAPEWLGDPLAARGVDGSEHGPLVVDRSVLTGGNPFVRWSVVPDVARTQPEDLQYLAEGAERAKELVTEADVTGRGIVAQGDLAPTAARAARGLAIGEAFGFLPVSLLLLVAVVGLVQVAGLLAATRERELDLLFARGASARQVLGSGLAEAAAVAVAGSAVGTAVAAVTLRLLGGHWDHTPTVLTGGLLGLGIALVCLAGVAANATLRAARGGRARSDRVKAVAGAAALVLVVSAAALATWQLRRVGTFIRDADGVTTTDLLPALAPALLLAAAAVVGLVVLAPVTRILEAVAGGLRSTAAWLAGAQLARGLVVQAVPVVLTVLATGTATFAALYAGTGTTLARDVASLSQGAPLRATLGPIPKTTLDIPTLDGVPGVTSSIPVWLDENALVGDLRLNAMAAPMAVLDEVSSLPGDEALPTGDLLLPVADTHAPAPLPDGAGTLTVTLTGATSLDPWEQQALPLLPDYFRDLADSLIGSATPAERNAMVSSNMMFTADTLAKPVTVDSILILRDARTGWTAQVKGPTLEVPGFEVTADDDWTALTLAETSAETSLDIALPEGSQFLLDGILLEPTFDSFGSPLTRTNTVTVSVSADGSPVLGAATADWRADTALPYAAAQPYRDAEAAVTPEARLIDSETNINGEMVPMKDLSSNRPHTPVNTVDTTGETWTVTFGPNLSNLNVGPQAQLDPNFDPLGAMATSQRPEPLVVPVAVTPAVAEATTLGVGDAMDVTLFGRPVPAQVVAVTEFIPGLTSPLGLVVDTHAWSASRALEADTLVGPTELWAGFDGDPAATREAASRIDGVSDVVVTNPTPTSDIAPAAQAFWVAAASALVLAITGLAAATATQVAHRRPEVAVLRAMGMTPAAQGRSRAWEIGGVLGLATLAGIGFGWLAGWLVVDPVTRSAATEPVAFPTRLTLDVVPWLALLGIGAAAVALILFALSRAVRRQALDNEYREEVR